MSATRVRVSFEFRNGDGNYLQMEPRPGRFVPCNGIRDQGAIEAAFLVALEEHGITQEKIRTYLENHRPPNHD